MTISIPDSVFDLYHETMDLLMTNDNFSRVCKVYYPPRRVECANCVNNHMGGPSANVYQHGGPAPFNNTGCTYCGGNGYKEEEVTDTLRLRIYFDKRDWITTANPLATQRMTTSLDSIVMGNTVAQIIGYSTDLPKILQAKEIQIISEQRELEHRYVLSGEPFFHGFGKKRYFVGYIVRC